MKGSFHQSRRQSNFYNYLKPDKQLAYAKQWVATLNSKLLEPFVRITGATKYNREVFYEIDIERLLKVEEENQQLREALEFYANQENWKRHNTTEPYSLDGGFEAPTWEPSTIEFDEGKIARKALGDSE